MINWKGGSKMSTFYLDDSEMSKISGKMEELSAKGVVVSEEHSGEMNFAGCATGHCQAWD